MNNIPPTGSNNQITRFAIGLIMLVAGGYMLLNAIHVGYSFHHIYHIRGVGTFTSGYIMIPFMFGIGMIFYNSRNMLGWLLLIGSLVMLIVGVISSVQFRLSHMTAFELMTILVLMVGGLGLFLSSLRGLKK
ncbi:hypothetical protein [uncultured Microscilla sp.]|uniref:hypothetical protein n=1 Tax=uncultured Microscilla sp. TaxID=432653 RepID=UPI0026219E27|nr:hypothetical protein [uncultured Microscilla sp.]